MNNAQFLIATASVLGALAEDMSDTPAIAPEESAPATEPAPRERFKVKRFQSSRPSVVLRAVRARLEFNNADSGGTTVDLIRRYSTSAKVARACEEYYLATPLGASYFDTLDAACAKAEESERAHRAAARASKAA